MKDKLYLRYFVISLGLHLAVIVALLVNFSFFQRDGQPQPKEVKIIDAVAVDGAAVEKEFEKMRAQEQARKEAELRRQRELEQQRREAEAAKKREQQRLAEEKRAREEAAKQKQAEEARRQAEEQKRLEAERQRKLEEQKRLEAERKAREAEQKRLEEERRKAEEARKRKEAEEQRKREEAERLRREEEARRQAQIAAEERARQVRAATATLAQAISSRLQANWRRPPDIEPRTEPQIQIRVTPDGKVIDVRTVRSSGNDIYDRSVEDAAWRASPLPMPSDPDIARELAGELAKSRITFEPN